MDALVLADGDLRIHADGIGDRDGLVIRDVHIVDGGISHRLQAAFVVCECNDSGKHILQSVFIENALAVHIFNDLAGSLALPETGDGDLAPVPAVYLLDGGIKFLRGDFHDKTAGALFLFFAALNVHFESSHLLYESNNPQMPMYFIRLACKKQYIFLRPHPFSGVSILRSASARILCNPRRSYGTGSHLPVR